MLANKLRGHVSIGGGALMLVCDFNALCEIEAHFDDDLDRGLAAIDRGLLTMQDQRAVVAALLRHHNPRVTLLDAGAVISEHLSEIGSAILEALATSLPEVTTEKKPQRRKARAA